MSTTAERWRGIRRILALRLDNLGDVIMTGPALRAVKEALPGSHLTLMVSPGGEEAAGLLPWVDGVLVWRSLWQDMGQLPFEPAREFGLIQTLQALRFEAAIIFTSFSQTPQVAGYACYLAGIPLRLGEPKDFGGAVLSHTPFTPTPLEAHQVDRNLRLLESVGIQPSDRSLSIDIPAKAREEVSGLLYQSGLPQGAPYLLLCPWTSCQARTYKHFGAVGQRLRRAVGLPIVVAGAKRDQPQAAGLLRELDGGAVDLVGKTSFPGLAALVAGARLTLTNNTAAMHLADATRTPQVVLFAGTELEEQWAPRDGPARVLRRPTPCRPCFQLSCSRGLACLDVDPGQVVGAAVELLEASQACPSPESVGEAQTW